MFSTTILTTMLEQYGIRRILTMNMKPTAIPILITTRNRLMKKIIMTGAKRTKQVGVIKLGILQRMFRRL